MSEPRLVYASRGGAGVWMCGDCFDVRHIPIQVPSMPEYQERPKPPPREECEECGRDIREVAENE